MKIALLDAAATADGATVIEYVGGPFAGARESIDQPPLEIRPSAAAGAYRRSARCADDGALRYVWRETDPTPEGGRETE